VEIAERASSWRKDDTRLHVDAFPSSPVQGNRILRVFSNVNPHGQSRTWLLGESFENVAHRHLPSLRGPLWGASLLLTSLGVTKGRRSAYDHFMLHIHDRMKADAHYQADVSESCTSFAPAVPGLRSPTRYRTRPSPASTPWSSPSTCPSPACRTRLRRRCACSNGWQAAADLTGDADKVRGRQVFRPELRIDAEFRVVARSKRQRIT
jgi:hypothetical protein